jgi:hypothetical protein
MCFTSVPVLHHFDLDRKIAVETDISNLLMSGVLSQHDNEGIFHPVAYVLGKYSLINYKIYDKRLLTIIYIFKEWRFLLKGFPHTIEVISDY